eukprot:TRINITY_DN49993_c0_g1_i1.p1 TRINITY_DN49993_c0_g1~~TRINITY_DN49993_c0_g1_i1.p1  ORF type:complete len:361 (+),score=62.90 TRINITY_DN49993_c0_g1_i1:162-1244(+)
MCIRDRYQRRVRGTGLGVTMRPAVRAVVMDNPVLDMVVHCPSSILDSFALVPGGSCPEMQDLALKKTLFDSVNTMQPVLTPGGGALNSARAMAWMVPPAVAADIAAIGVVGRDDEARVLASRLEEAGVRPLFGESADQRTGKCAILVTGEDRDRCIVADPQAARELAAEHVEPHLPRLEDAQLCLLPAYIVTGPPSRLAAALLAADTVTRSGHFCLSLSSAGLLNRLRASGELRRVRQLAERAAYVFCNQEEFRSYLLPADLPECSLQQAVARAEINAHVVITNGAKETVLVTRESTRSFPIPREHAVQPEDVKDLNGAGDAFAGGFLAGVLLGETMEECVRAGQYCACLLYTSPSPRDS